VIVIRFVWYEYNIKDAQPKVKRPVQVS